MYTKLTITERLKDLRVERHLTLEQLAQQTGISKAALGKYETDDFKDISPFSIATLARFYGVSADYLMGLTEQKNHPNTELDALHLSDDGIDAIKSGRFNTRLLSELLCHPEFERLMVDMEIYVDHLASMQIDSLNAYVDTTRQMVEQKYAPRDNDLHRRTLELAHIQEDDYFAHTLQADLIAILRDIREAHKSDTTTAPETPVAADFRQKVDEVLSAKGSPEEKTLKAYLASMGINYDSLTPEEVVTLIGILQKSDLLKSPTSRRGKSTPKSNRRKQ